jgi:phosphoglycerate dehydrogenase-like enzyme
MLKQADVITIHTPLTAETKNFFDREKLALVKNTAILANTARAALFDENALYEKLSNSDCRAYFDVFWEEPYSGKLKDLGPRKFLMTPHSASNTKEFLEAGFQQILNIAEDLSQ